MDSNNIKILNQDFYYGKKVLVTGNTGFKGSWICEVLLFFGAEVVGYALEPPTTPNLYSVLQLDKRMKSIIGDIRDLHKLKEVFEQEKPEIVIHMAAQPLVRESYKNPVYTYDVNVMGTVNVLECIRLSSSVKSFINVTTDKVYKNKEWEWGYRENEELNGFDPYSNSKSCSELISDSYKNSFFSNKEVAISTVRAGNVIGGGDFAIDRIVPDCVKAAIEERDIIIRNPYAIRPFQHVLEPILGYLLIAKEQYKNKELSGSYNIGPNDVNCITVGELADIFCNLWTEKTGKEIVWINQYDGGPQEAKYLKLDCSKIKNKFDWKPYWNINMAIDKSIELYLGIYDDLNVKEKIREQIVDYIYKK